MTKITYFTVIGGILLVLVVVFALMGQNGCKPEKIAKNISSIFTPPKLSSEEIRTFTSERYIPQAIQALEEMGRSETATLWRVATVGDPVLQWTLREEDMKIVPLNWVVPVEQNGVVIGLIGLDPDSGDFMWRVDQKGGLFPPLSKSRAEEALQSTASPQYSSEEAKIVLISKRNYWCFPTISSNGAFDTNIERFLTVSMSPDDLCEVATISQILKNQQRQGGILNGEVRPSIPPRTAKPQQKTGQ